MSRVFLYIFWAFGFALCFIPYIITSQLYPLEGAEWIENWEAHYTQKRLAHSSGFFVSLALVAVYFYKTLTIVKNIRLDLLKLKGIITVLVAILLLSEINHAIRYSTPIHYIGTATIATLYGLAFAALMTMYQSVKSKNKRKRWLMLLVGFACIVISWFSLETLYKTSGR